MTRSGVLNWDDIRPIAQHYFVFWPDKEDLTWLKGLWPYIEKAGLSIFHSEKEEMQCRSIPACMALLYQELICRLGEYGVKSLSDEHYRELFADGIECVESTLMNLRNTLSNSVGEQFLLNWTVRSVLLGSRPPVPNAMLDEELCELTTFPLKNVVIERMFDFLNSESFDLKNFESIAVSLERKVYEV